MPGLGRRPFFDERSRAFPIRTLVAEKPLRSYTWSCGVNLDQGSEGACVGFAFGHEISARPLVQPVTNEYARDVYLDAQKVDAWPGEDYSGTSVLAGAKVCQARGHFAEYRWAFGLSDLQLALGYAGPAVLGLNWYTGQMTPDSTGRIRPTGSIEGGHAILAYRVWLPNSTRPEGQVWLWNSWGSDWGKGGACWLTFADLERLLHEDGEAVVPIGRRMVETVL